MQHSDYVPLHLHTEYSLLDGAIRIKELVKAASAMKMPAVAVTDHGNLFGAVEFYRRATKGGIKPIIGCEVYVAPRSRFDKTKAQTEEGIFHLVLLAKDNDGYRNLVTLVSKAYTEGFYYKPRIDRDLLEQYSGGLIGLTACLRGEVPYYLRSGDLERARDAALAYKHILGPDNFFLELQENGLKEQIEVNRMLVELGRELHIGLVATNDCHYLRREDAKAHDVLLCIQTGKTVSDRNRLRFEGDGFYFKSPEEMKEAFKDIPEAVLNTRAIAERCNVEFKLGANLLPKYETPDGSRPSAFLEKIAQEGLRQKFQNPTEVYSARLEYEISVVKKMGYASYFLIVWDFINYAKKNDIPVGPGRGSAAGSLIAYVVGITEVDPLKYGLLFERFLNPDRINMPDIDVDFCKDKRPRVISYVARKYGKDHVAQIITFGTMAARAAIRDVARALDFPYAEADRLAKLVPEGPKTTIDKAMKLEPRLREAYDAEPRVKEMLDIARRLEGLARHASTHAAGVVISPEPLTDYTPLYKSPSDETITTQFDMGSVERLGLVKFDFLGLRTLTVIEKALNYIRENNIRENNGDFSLKDIPLNDKKTYALLGSGQSAGIFQLESHGMRDILTKMRPGRFEDLIALVALYRPGPIGSGMIEDFINRKGGKTPVKYDLPQLKEILEETYGVILYQEQVMSIANKVANFTMGQADILRKAMGKKKPMEMEKQKENFIKGASANGVPEKKASRLFDIISGFAEYGFNKSHSAAYALIAYQTAYLKAHYPVEFMAATLSSDLDNTDKVVKYINECRNMSIKTLPPDINLCGREFTVIGQSIRFGLGAVKGVGTSAIESILSVRQAGPFASFEDFLVRTDTKTATKKVNKRVIESLVKAGAFDSLPSGNGHPGPSGNGQPDLKALGRWRARLMDMAGGGSEPSLSLFGQADGTGEEEGWDEAELLRHEKEALGFYITGSPLMKYKKALELFNVKGISALEGIPDKQQASTAGMIASLKKMRTRGKAELMAYLTLEDDEGTVEVIVFPELYKAHAALLKKDAPLFVSGTLDRPTGHSDKEGAAAPGEIKIIARELSSLDELLSNGNNRPGFSRVEIRINSRNPDLKALRDLLAGNSGGMPLYLRIAVGDAEAIIQTSFGVQPSVPLMEGVENFLGKGAVKVV